MVNNLSLVTCTFAIINKITLINIYYCMSRRAIWENIQLERWQYWPERSQGLYGSSRMSLSLNN